jgi:hypothetical protein
MYPINYMVLKLSQKQRSINNFYNCQIKQLVNSCSGSNFLTQNSVDELQTMMAQPTNYKKAILLFV